MSRLERYLPVALSLLLPGVGMLNNLDGPWRDNVAAVLPRWLFFSSFLFVVWKLNQALIYRLQGAKKWWALVVINGGISVGFVLIVMTLFPNGLDLRESSPVWVRFMRMLFVSTVYITIIETLQILRERERLRVENLTLHAENLQAQFDQLKQQVNPHFLFNSLSTLRMMVRSQDAESEEYVLRLSDVYRQILTHRQSDVVALREEMAFLDSYLYLLQLRHEKALHVEKGIELAKGQGNLPVFALQLLVENALKHNIVSESKPLRLRLYQPDGQHIVVANNYQPKTVKPESFGVGLSNLDERYRLLGREDGVQITQTASEYVVTLALIGV